MLIVDPMLQLMDTPDDVIGPAAEYLRIYFSGISGLMIYNMGSGILRAVGDSRRPLYFLIFAAVINTVLDLVFVISFGWGVAGVAWARSSPVPFRHPFAFRLTRSRPSTAWSGGSPQNRPTLKDPALGFPTSLQMGITSFSNVFVQSYITLSSPLHARWASYIKIDICRTDPADAFDGGNHLYRAEYRRLQI